MKRFKTLGLLLLCGLLLSLVLTPATLGGQAPRKIIVFERSFADPTSQARLVDARGGAPLKHLSLINALAVRLPEAAARALARRPEVALIADDAVMTIRGHLIPCGRKPPKPPKPDEPPPQPTETLPWGIDRIDADLAWAASPYAQYLECLEAGVCEPVKVAIVDTGVDLNHPDLQANLMGGFNAVNPRKGPDDDNGHGTHVAGTVAAIDNEIGVIGVGPRMGLYAVKVLKGAGWGFVSDIIDGIGWCVGNGMEVANMSWGGPYNEPLRLAIVAAHQAGIVMVCAAGNNDGGPVDYPAAYPETIAVSATTEADWLASFSSEGAQVDLAAPGENILSTYRDGYYAWGSGTSMAAPHVSGTAALVLAAGGALSPEALRSHLKATAEDLGLASDQQGAGLVDAYGALTP